MKQEDKTIQKAVDMLKQNSIPPGPSGDLANTTLDKLNHISGQSEQIHHDRDSSRYKKFTLNNALRIAASVIILITAGYVTGKVTTTKQIDTMQMQSELEPLIREKLYEEIYSDVQLDITAAYLQLREELTEQYRQELNQNTLEILNTQLQEKQLIVAALKQLELNRLEDKTQLGSAIVNFASITEHDLQRTQNNLAAITELLIDTETNNIYLNENENIDN